MKNAKFRSVGNQKGSGATNEKIPRDTFDDTQKSPGVTHAKITRNTSVDTQKGSGVTHEKIARNTSVDTQKGSGVTHEKIARNTSVDTQKGSGVTHEKIARNTSVDTQKGSGVTHEKIARNTSVDTQKGSVASYLKKALNISVFTQSWGDTNEKKAKDIVVDTQKWEATNDKNVKDISVNNQRSEESLIKKARDISVNTQKAVEPMVKKARVISVVTQKGGVGKTATAINMSVGLHNLGYKVAAIDLDPQGQLAEGFGIRRKSLKKTMLDVLLGMAHMKDIKKKAYGVDLYLSNRSLANLGVTVQALSNVERYPNPYSLLKNALAQIDTKYDFIIIDTPPTVSIFNTNALNASTDAVIPMQPEGMAVKGAEDMIEFIREVQKSSNNKLNILGILATMVQNTNLHNTVMQEVRKSFIKSDITVFDTVIKRTIRYGSAQTEGVPDTKSFPEYTEFLKEALFGETA